MLIAKQPANWEGDLMYALQTFDLTKRFGDLVAVDHVNLKVQEGELFGFLGPNGAGKTTTISMILGLLYPTAGRVHVLGEEVSPTRTHVLRQVGAMVNTPGFLPYLSGRENLRLLARLYPDVDERRVDEVLELVGLRDAAKRKVKGYSTGMKQRLGLAAALLHRPRLLVLDEPTSGLDPIGMKEMRELLRALADGGTTIFLSSHLLHEVEQICDRVALIHQGRIVAEGEVRALLQQYKSLEEMFTTYVETP